MSTHAQLNDLQLILLATAIQREDGSILPIPESLAAQPERVHKAIPALLRRRLILEAPVTGRSTAWREEDEQQIGLVITEEGRAIIAAGSEDKTSVDVPTAPPSPNASSGRPALVQPRAGSKIEAVIGLLRSDEGATLAAMAEATGWLPHTTRAALTGLRKKGHAVTKTRRDDVTFYKIAQS